MKAVILAGGLGSRLKPFTEVIPKPLLPIGEKAVLEIQIEHLHKYGFNEIYLATNYKSGYIENFFGDGSRYGVKLFINKEEKPLGSIGPISLLQNELIDPFLVMNGDILTQLNINKFYDFAVNNQSIITITIKEMITPFRFGNIFYKGEFVTGLEEKHDFKTNILAGIYIMKPEIFNHIPYNEYYGMDALLMSLLADNIPISKYDIHEYWLDIGIESDYKEAQTIYNKLYDK